MRLAEVHLTLGLVHAHRGDLDAAASHGAQAFSYKRKSGPALLTQASALNKMLMQRFPGSRQTAEFEEQLRAFCDQFRFQPEPH